jgi:hypothetical protein
MALDPNTACQSVDFRGPGPALAHAICGVDERDIRFGFISWDGECFNGDAEVHVAPAMV